MMISIYMEVIKADALMSGYAMFALKDPSLLAFDTRRMRWLNKMLDNHPRLGIIIIVDGLSPNAPHIRELLSLDITRKHPLTT